VFEAGRRQPRQPHDGAGRAARRALAPALQPRPRPDAHGVFSNLGGGVDDGVAPAPGPLLPDAASDPAGARRRAALRLALAGSKAARRDVAVHRGRGPRRGNRTNYDARSARREADGDADRAGESVRPRRGGAGERGGAAGRKSCGGAGRSLAPPLRGAVAGCRRRRAGPAVDLRAQRQAAGVRRTRHPAAAGRQLARVRPGRDRRPAGYGCAAALAAGCSTCGALLGSTRLSSTPTTVASAMPCSRKGPICSAAPPMPTTRMTEAMTRLRLSEKSIWLSTSVRTPDDAMMPNRTMATPPMTGAGMDWMSAPSLGMNDRAMARAAAKAMTRTANTRVMAITPTFSP